MPGYEGTVLRRRLAAQRGFRTHLFRYSSVHEPLASLVSRLRQAVARIEAPEVHLLGHSLGGLIIHRCLQLSELSRPGRVIFLGTPARGSSAARRFATWRLGRRLMGPLACEELLRSGGRRWDSGRELGLIAGTRPVGLGHLLLTFHEPNDGMVAVSETELPGATARLTLPVTHSGMLLSARVAREAGSFLQHGRFGA